ncbi:hypothetical protein BDV06DRAFT_184231 [Aspergillus oleicola]
MSSPWLTVSSDQLPRTALQSNGEMRPWTSRQIDCRWLKNKQCWALQLPNGNPMRRRRSVVREICDHGPFQNQGLSTFGVAPNSLAEPAQFRNSDARIYLVMVMPPSFCDNDRAGKGRDSGTAEAGRGIMWLTPDRHRGKPRLQIPGLCLPSCVKQPHGGTDENRKLAAPICPR